MSIPVPKFPPISMDQRTPVVVLVRSHGYSYAEITSLAAVRWVTLIGEMPFVHSRALVTMFVLL